MAGVADSRLYKAGPWPRGICNATEEGVLPLNDFGSRPIALRDAVNVTLTANGTPARRDGAEKVLDVALGHSLWSDAKLPFALLVYGGELHVLHPGGVCHTLGTTVGNLDLSYALVNDKVFFTNPAVCGQVTLDLDVQPWAPAAPDGQPLVAAASGGTLPAGTYQVAVTFTDSFGRESGSTLAAVVDVEDNGVIAVSAIPQPSAGGMINVYCTAANDGVLRQAMVLVPGILSANVTMPATGRPLQTQFLDALPPGHIVRFGHGRQWVARGNWLLWSEPLRYGQFNPATNCMRFDGEIELVEPIGDGGAGAGVFVCANNRSYWLDGAAPAEFRPRTVAHEGAVPGSSWREDGPAFGRETNDIVVLWLSRKGTFRLGAPGGVIDDPNPTALADNADRAAVLRRNGPGLEHLVVTLQAPHTQVGAAADSCVTYHVPAAMKR